MKKRYNLYFLFSLLFACGISSMLSAQCDQVGIVLSKDADCGVQILDLNQGAIYLATEGATQFGVGETLSFSSEASTSVPSACLNGINQAVALTCVSVDLPCKADFVSYADASNPHHIHLSADIYDEDKQTCTWDFGDGIIKEGKDINFLFATKGTYSVKLTVSSAHCTASKTQTIEVSDVNLNNCGFRMDVTAVGLNLVGKMQSLTTGGQSELRKIEWYNGRSNALLSEEPVLDFPLPDYGTYNVCATYRTQLDNGETCEAQDCHTLSVHEPGCHNPSLADPSIICPASYAPVCGCDGVSYSSECEAMAVGVMKWWVGACHSQGADCAADFDYKILSGSPSEGYEVEFTNLSSGTYHHASFDFGDGTPLNEDSDWTTITHHYAAGGMFLAQASVWKDEDAVSVASSMVATDAASVSIDALPNGTGYVLPGDTDGDGKANAHDILNIGVGYHKAGTPRPNATLDWQPQLSPNWSSHTGPGINNKHLDCDGNGLVNEFDPAAIAQHYQAIDTVSNAQVPNAPEVFLRFPTDTITLDPNAPQSVTISADLMVGKPTKPVFGLYGLSLAMTYPDFVNHNTIGYYTGADFFGESNLTLWMQRNNHSKQQLDMGFVRKTGTPVSGYGRIAKIDFQSDFIIIVDVILREDSEVMPFVVNLSGLKGIDEHGNEMALNVQTNTDTVWIKVPQISSGVFDATDTKALTISPNPASDLTQVTIPTHVSNGVLEVFNQHGQRVSSTSFDGIEQQVDVSDLPTGLYQVKISSDSGIYAGRLLKK